MRFARLFLVLFLFSSCAHASLSQKIQRIADDAHGKVSVACSLPGSSLDGDLNPHAHAPMQSVFKLPLVLTVLHEVEQGRLALDQPIRFRPEDLFVPHAYSPLQDQYPQANVDIPLRRLAQLSVSLSDNAAADLLLRLIGGPRIVEDYIASLGVRGFHLVDNEHAMHRDQSLQYRNWFEPAGAVQLLRRLSDDSPLTPAHTELLLGWMRDASLTTRLRGDLPSGTIVAHKTGSSDVVQGLAAATNDIGLITLPDRRRLAIAVFITDSRADDATRDKVIARIARTDYDEAIQAKPSH